MENIMIFLGTVAVYFTVIVYLDSWTLHKSVWDYSWEKATKMLAVIALLVLPLNIDGNVFTIAGNATAEKSAYSFFSLYQRAEQDAITFFGLAGYQQAGHDAATIFGIAGYQQAGQEAGIGFGLAIYQKSEVKALALAAIALYQRVGEKTRAFGAFSALTKD